MPGLADILKLVGVLGAGAAFGGGQGALAAGTGFGQSVAQTREKRRKEEKEEKDRQKELERLESQRLKLQEESVRHQAILEGVPTEQTGLSSILPFIAPQPGIEGAAPAQISGMSASLPTLNPQPGIQGNIPPEQESVVKFDASLPDRPATAEERSTEEVNISLTDRQSSLEQLLAGIGIKQQEREAIDLQFRMLDAQRKDPITKMQTDLARQAAQEGQQVTIQDPTTGEFRLLSIPEITQGTQERIAIAAEAEQEKKRQESFLTHQRSLERIGIQANVSEDLKRTQLQLDKEMANYRDQLKKDNEFQYKWGNISNSVKTEILELADVRQMINLVQEQIDDVVGAFGPLDKRVDVVVRAFGGEGKAGARAMISRLRATILFGMGGKALTKTEKEELAGMVPNIGSPAWFGDNDNELLKKLDSLEEFLNRAVRNRFNLELSEGKIFDASVLETMGFNIEDVGLPNLKILPNGQEASRDIDASIDFMLNQSLEENPEVP